MYNLIEYGDVYSKTSGILWQYYKQKAALDDKNNITDFPANNNNSVLFRVKKQTTCKQERVARKMLK